MPDGKDAIIIALGTVCFLGLAIQVRRDPALV